MILRLYIPSETAASAPLGVRKGLSNVDALTSCYFRETSRDGMRWICDVLDSLSITMRNITFGPVKLFVHLSFDPTLDQWVTEFSAKDTLMQISQCAGLCLRVQLDRIECFHKHKHVDTVSIVHVLRAFAWPCVETLIVTQSLPSNTYCDEWQYGLPVQPDPLSAVLPEDKDELERNLRCMTGLRCLQITVTYRTLLDGAPILRSLSRYSSMALCPELNTLHLVADKSIKHGYPARAQLWYDVLDFLRSRSWMKPTSSSERSRIILEGVFLFSCDDLLALDQMKHEGDVVELPRSRL